MSRLHSGLKHYGVDSRILCAKRTTNSADVATLPRADGFRAETVLRSVTSRLGLNDIHRVGSFRLARHAFSKDADVVHFHCTHSGTFSYLAFPVVSRQKPCVFSLHDMWAITGHCGYSYDCDRWKTGCGRCPYPKEHPRVVRDGTRLEWRLKQWAYRHSSLTFISKSSWITRQVRGSMIRDLPLYEIPYGVDTHVYRPLDREACRDVLDLPADRKVLLFVAQSLHSRRKGGDLLVKALQALPPRIRSETMLVVLGRGDESFSQAAGIPTRQLGYVEGDHLKAVVYSAADLFLFPTRADVFGLVSLESQACGTPVVAFGVTGVPDHVRPGVTGYLAEAENALDFRDGIVRLLDDDSLRSSMGVRCRETVLREFSLDLEVQRHLELYRKLATNGADLAVRTA